MIYCYSCQCRMDQALTFAIGTAPPEVPCPCGDKAVRNFAAENAGPASFALKADRKYPYVSNRLPKNLDGCEHTAKGKPVIMSPAHEKNVAAACGMSRE